MKAHWTTASAVVSSSCFIFGEALCMVHAIANRFRAESWPWYESSAPMKASVVTPKPSTSLVDCCSMSKQSSTSSLRKVNIRWHSFQDISLSPARTSMLPVLPNVFVNMVFFFVSSPEPPSPFFDESFCASSSGIIWSSNSACKTCSKSSRVKYWLMFGSGTSKLKSGGRVSRKEKYLPSLLLTDSAGTATRSSRSRIRTIAFSFSRACLRADCTNRFWSRCSSPDLIT
mmetsp:Transcript_3096/g.7187  ORF Transcript_3096/g.7187 Transcript_3096/m.7187 type:complete len:229 (-) Transcript_3096:3971-4657(-)